MITGGVKKTQILCIYIGKPNNPKNLHIYDENSESMKWASNRISPDGTRLKACTWHSNKLNTNNNFGCDIKECSEYSIWDVNYNCYDLCYLDIDKKQEEIDTKVRKLYIQSGELVILNNKIKKYKDEYDSIIEKKIDIQEELIKLGSDILTLQKEHESKKESIPTDIKGYERRIFDFEKKFKDSEIKYEQLRKNNPSEDKLQEIDSLTNYSENKRTLGELKKSLDSYKFQIEGEEKIYKSKSDNLINNQGLLKAQILEIEKSSKSGIHVLIYYITNGLNMIKNVDMTNILGDYKLKPLTEIKELRSMWTEYIFSIKKDLNLTDAEITKIYDEQFIEITNNNKDRAYLNENKGKTIKVKKGRKFLNPKTGKWEVADEGYMAGSEKSDIPVEISHTKHREYKEILPEVEYVDIEAENRRKEREFERREKQNSILYGIEEDLLNDAEEKVLQRTGAKDKAYAGESGAGRSGSKSKTNKRGGNN